MIAFSVSLVLGLLSMGFLGVALYYPVASVLSLRFPPLDQWHGDWVWPAFIGVGMVWSVGFLIAGAVNHYLANQQLRSTLRGMVYVGVLWTCALLLWLATLAFSPNTAPF